MGHGLRFPVKKIYFADRGSQGDQKQPQISPKLYFCQGSGVEISFFCLPVIFAADVITLQFNYCN